MEYNKSELESLIQLLDDDDKEVFNHVFEKLFDYGVEVIPFLESAWEDSLDPVLHERLGRLVHKIQFESLLNELQAFTKMEPANLERGIYLLTKYKYPNYEYDDLRNSLAELEKKIWIEFNDHLTEIEKINLINQIIYGNEKFKVNYEEFKSESSYFINNALNNKHANPSTLAILYLILARKFDLPVYWVNLPNYPVLCLSKFEVEDYEVDKVNASRVMFYINSINKGALFSKAEIEDYLESIGMDSKSHAFFSPAKDEQLLKVHLQFLLKHYQLDSKLEKVEEINRMLTTFPF